MLNIFINQSYSDFDAYNEDIKNWDLEFLQLGRGRFHAEILVFGDGELQIGKVNYNKLLLQNGSSPSNRYTFAIHNDESAPFLWRYQEFEFDSIIIFPENRELHGVSQPGHHPFTVAFTEDILARVSGALGLPDPENFIVKGKVCPCDPIHMTKLRNFLSATCCEVTRTQGKYLDALTIDTVKWHLATLLLSALATSRDVKQKKRNVSNRRKVVDLTLEYVDSDLSTPRSIQQLCSVANVNERTLRNIFYDHFYISPQQFFKSYRLNAVRKTLLQGIHSQVKIIDIASSHGFWHMGQFANDYFKQFGELPSATLFRA